MKDRHIVCRPRPAGILAAVVALAVAGCGGDASTPPGKTDGVPAKDSSTPAAASQKTASTGRLKGMAPGGDMGVRERRAQKLKERAAAKE